MKTDFYIQMAFFLFISLVSCNTKSQYNEATKITADVPVVSVPNIDKNKVIKYTDVFDSLSFVKLETAEESIIGRIDKLIVFENFIFVLDLSISKSVFVFDREGKFLNKVGKVGKGVAEYIFPADIQIDKIHNKIYILAGSRKKLLVYNFDGSFIKEIMIPVRTSTFGLGDNTIFCYSEYYPKSSKERYAISILDKEGKLIKKVLSLSPKLDNVKTSTLRSFQNFDDKIICTSLYSNYVFEINDNVISPYYYIDFNDHNISLDGMDVLTKNMFRRKLKIDKVATLNSFFETSSHIVFVYTYNGILHNAFYSKATRKLHHASQMINNMCYFINFRTISQCENNEVVGYIESSTFDEFAKLYDFDKSSIKTQIIDQANKINSSGRYNLFIETMKSLDLQLTDKQVEFIQSVRLDDNPVVAFMKLKEF